MIVTVTDYQPDNTYVVGKMEASAALDAARAGTQLMNKTFTASAPSAYDMFVWGHSQGGHAALWTGQLAETYLAATHPSHPTASLDLIGIAALAPASNFITLPDQPGVAPGDGLADWEMHKNIGLDLPVASLRMHIGPALFAHIFGSWNALASDPAPSATAAFPAYLVAASPLAISGIVTETPGAGTVQTVQNFCLYGDQAKQVQSNVELYNDAKTNQMLVPSVWNLPADYTTGQYFKGGLDASCAASTDAALQPWCSWMRFNIPGPLGVNPYPKVPTVAGATVPLFMAQGSADDVVHCVAPAGTPKATVPDAADCMTRALYDSLASADYCPAGVAAGHLEFTSVRKTPLQSPASHFGIPGEISAAGLSKNASDLVFTGSPLQKFMAAAFDRTTTAGCTLSVLNPTD